MGNELDFLKQFNWVDIFILILFLRITCISLKTGLIVEFFKILGTLTAVYLSLHYYTSCADFFAHRIGKNQIEILEFFFLIILALGGYIFFTLLRLLWCQFVTTEVIPMLSRWGGLILGLARCFLLSSLVLFIFIISFPSYFNRSIVDSFSAKFITNIAPTTYSWFWHNLILKFKTNEEFNKSVLDVLEEIK